LERRQGCRSAAKTGRFIGVKARSFLVCLNPVASIISPGAQDREEHRKKFHRGGFSLHTFFYPHTLRNCGCNFKDLSPGNLSDFKGKESMAGVWGRHRPATNNTLNNF